MDISSAERKSAVLGPSTLACLSDMATINVTLGCAHNCTYCYGKTYRSYPGEGKVVVYTNLLRKSQAELPRKRKPPAGAYFCPSCDPFQPIPEVLDSSYNLMKLFLSEGVPVTFLTKGRIPDRFLRLFELHPDRVSAQIGLNTLDDEFLRLSEPGAPNSAVRLTGLGQLSGMHVPTVIRLDPMWPAITDTEGQLGELLEAARQNGAAGVAV